MHFFAFRQIVQNLESKIDEMKSQIQDQIPVHSKYGTSNKSFGPLLKVIMKMV